ncbi:uncharacterized protein LOC128230197 [Mya arenaria]|uniref:uncharacterized protein LOC128230197 n=1 Tax=Mya arenaria TaxID=6604 RepID=UPI0022E1460B|nr:uncharacterized protein LOC128230197 [Mya arenaria]XP_052798222.1 uncharacterized protein LOC128230197 [Mya arenaria]
MKNIRSGLNRHLTDLGRNMDIVHGTSFKVANRTLDGFMKKQTKAGLSRPTHHKPIIEQSDLETISRFFANAPCSPIILRQCVWFQLALHFVSRGLEFHHQLQIDSFEFTADHDGIEYVTLKHETQKKIFQGGLTKDEAPSDRRMYTTGGPCCLVAMLKLLINKTDKSAPMLFNACFKDAIARPEANDIWFTNAPLSKRSYSSFMADICKASKITGWYTAHSVRATAIQAMNDSGFEARHIMFMSGHRNEASLKSYCRAPSDVQKKELSSTLSLLASSGSTSANIPIDKHVTPPTATGFSSDVKVQRNENTLADLSNTIFQHSSFANCFFNITLNK